ncbi:MAG: response regulator [Deltaproteobacteria bacterium]|nr:response regulator [Deltaproteobacteria bacterium]
MTGAHATVLVVEDSPTMRQLLTYALMRLGDIEVLEAEDGLDALRKLAARTAPVELVITDINMPNLDGLKLIARLRADDATRDVPIVVITTDSGEGDRERAMALGATSYIEKPLQAPKVLEVARRLLGREPAP